MTRKSIIYLKRPIIGTHVSTVGQTIIYGRIDKGSDYSCTSYYWKAFRKWIPQKLTCSTVFKILLIIVAIVMQTLLVLHKLKVWNLFPQVYPWWLTLMPIPTLSLVLGIYSLIDFACRFAICAGKKDRFGNSEIPPEDILCVLILLFLVPPNVLFALMLDGSITGLIPLVFLILLCIIVVVFFSLLIYYFCQGGSNPRSSAEQV